MTLTVYTDSLRIVGRVHAQASVRDLRVHGFAKTITEPTMVNGYLIVPPALITHGDHPGELQLRDITERSIGRGTQGDQPTPRETMPQAMPSSDPLGRRQNQAAVDEILRRVNRRAPREHTARSGQGPR
jgi:hypothetical protein